MEVNDGYCSDLDTLTITVKENICPVADAGEDIRIPKYDSRSVTLSAGGSLDPDGSSLLYEWTSPNGSIINDLTVLVMDQDLDSRYSEYIYLLRVMDSEGAEDIDSVPAVGVFLELLEVVLLGLLKGRFGYPHCFEGVRAGR